MTANLPATATLILIDIQQGLDDPVYGRRNNPDAEANVARLLERWRSSGRPLIHIQHLSTSPSSPLRPGQDGVEIKPEVAPIAGERIITKRVNCAFIGTDLEAVLRREGATPLVITGLTTNHCVETTARVAGDLGFSPILVSDAAATFDRIAPDGRLWPAETIHAVTLTSLNGEFAEIATTEDILWPHVARVPRCGSAVINPALILCSSCAGQVLRLTVASGSIRSPRLIV